MNNIHIFRSIRCILQHNGHRHRFLRFNLIAILILDFDIKEARKGDIFAAYAKLFSGIVQVVIIFLVFREDLGDIQGRIFRNAGFAVVV